MRAAPPDAPSPPTSEGHEPAAGRKQAQKQHHVQHQRGLKEAPDAAAAAAAAAAGDGREQHPGTAGPAAASSPVDAGDSHAPPSHPYGVQPWGNFYLSRVPEIRTAGLGPHLASLPDEVVLGILYLLPARDLARLGLASRALYCFAHTYDLWKSLVLQELGGDFDWCGSWRETYLAHAAPPGSYARGSHRPLRVEGFYSDFLHQPWFCATVELQPAWLEVDNIDRRSGLTPEEFRQQYEAANRPVLLTDGASDWPALHKWTKGYLAAALAGRPVIVGNASWRFGSYLQYCEDGAAADEMPLYLFDKAFASSCPHLLSDYSVPHPFSEDLFEVLGEEGRPDYRWLIIGPHRSGSSFHIDPNATCAWNACVSGAKKWILFPPGCPPPGVYPSPDGADVAAPVSIIEWFLNFYDEARHAKVPPVECICRPGEVLYVPRGWWHCVLNLGHTVAVTQNFVSSTGLPCVLDFLRPGRADLVSGCAAGARASLHDRFVASLEAQRPAVMEALRAAQQRAQERRAAEHRLSLLFRGAGGGSHEGVDGGQQGQQQQQQRRREEEEKEGQQQDAGPAGARPTDGSSGAEAGPAAGGVASAGGGFSYAFQLPAAPDAGGDGGGTQGAAAAAAVVGFSFGFACGDEGGGTGARQAGSDDGGEDGPPASKRERGERQQQQEQEQAAAAAEGPDSRQGAKRPRVVA